MNPYLDDEIYSRAFRERGSRATNVFDIDLMSPDDLTLYLLRPDLHDSNGECGCGGRHA
jgi:hypothetical protein